MTKYRKKPVIIEAAVYEPGMEDGVACRIGGCRKDMDSIDYETDCKQCAELRPYINTLEGRHYISPGDYIITGVENERYPVKPSIFKKTYEKVEG